MNFDPVVVIPVYNHPDTIGPMVAAVVGRGLPCILVDDGCEPVCAAVLDALIARHRDRLTLVRLSRNQGKGGAMLAGFREAWRQQRTHVVQIDADGQHDPADIPLFLDQARKEPSSVVAGCPIYDESVPKGRLYGRYLTHVWVWIHTLSLAIRDSMCGFRVYPLKGTMALIDVAGIGKRMDFDTDILVRLYWRGLSVINQPTRVTYPQDGISHFRLGRDNLRITLMHVRLFFGMLARLPLLLWRKVVGS